MIENWQYYVVYAIFFLSVLWMIWKAYIKVKKIIKRDCNTTRCASCILQNICNSKKID